MDSLGVIQLRSADVAGAVQRATRALRQPDPIRSLGLEGALLELLALVSRRLGGSGTATPSRAVRQAEELIDEELHRRLTIAEIAAAVDVSPAGLVRAFRRERGYPIGDYVRRARVAASLRLLTETDAPLADIASRCGFFDQSHLGRVLKRQVGLTPAEVRRSRH